ncbi:MAG: hypothetical protein ACK5PS_11040 [Desulfopila sp.]
MDDPQNTMLWEIVKKKILCNGKRRREVQVTNQVEKYFDMYIKSRTSRQDGFGENFDLGGIVFQTAIWWYIGYSEVSFVTEGEGDRSFYESIIFFETRMPRYRYIKREA